MQCHQCTRAALYELEGGVALCLDCYHKLWQIHREQIAEHQREINYIADEMDMIAGLPRMGARYPERQAVTIRGVTLHNIKIDNSIVGSLNTGTIGKVDVAVSVALSEGHAEVANALKALTESVARSNALAAEQRNEALEILATIAEDLTSPREKRRPNMARTLSQRLREILSLSADTSQLWAQYGPILLAAFGA
jgi:hypothetical protein